MRRRRDKPARRCLLRGFWGLANLGLVPNVRNMLDVLKTRFMRARRLARQAFAT